MVDTLQKNLSSINSSAVDECVYRFHDLCDSLCVAWQKNFSILSHRTPTLFLYSKKLVQLTYVIFKHALMKIDMSPVTIY